MSQTTHLALNLPEFDTSPWHDEVNYNFQLLDSIWYSLTGLQVKGEWLNATDYVEDDIVLDMSSDILYRCAVNHTSAATGTFAADRAENPTYWETVQSLVGEAIQAAANAEAAATLAIAAYDNFDDRYLGEHAADPLLDNDGDALLTGALYFNTNDDRMKVYNGASWQTIVEEAAGELNDLGDVSITSVQDGDLLVYDLVSSAFINMDASTAGLVDLSAIANMLETSDIGVSVQAYDADTAKLDVEDQVLTGGVRPTSKSLGTITTGTLTVDPGDRPIQHYTNNGAHILTMAQDGYCEVLISNGSTAGVTTLTFDFVTGDALTTNNGHRFNARLSRINGFSTIEILARQ